MTPPQFQGLEKASNSMLGFEGSKKNGSSKLLFFIAGYTGAVTRGSWSKNSGPNRRGFFKIWRARAIQSWGRYKTVQLCVPLSISVVSQVTARLYLITISFFPLAPQSQRTTFPRVPRSWKDLPVLLLLSPEKPVPEALFSQSLAISQQAFFFVLLASFLDVRLWLVLMS